MFVRYFDGVLYGYSMRSLRTSNANDRHSPLLVSQEHTGETFLLLATCAAADTSVGKHQVTTGGTAKTNAGNRKEVAKRKKGRSPTHPSSSKDGSRYFPPAILKPERSSVSSSRGNKNLNTPSDCSVTISHTSATATGHSSEIRSPVLLPCHRQSST